MISNISFGSAFNPEKPLRNKDGSLKNPEYDFEKLDPRISVFTAGTKDEGIDVSASLRALFGSQITTRNNDSIPFVSDKEERFLRSLEQKKIEFKNGNAIVTTQRKNSNNSSADFTEVEKYAQNPETFLKNLIESEDITQIKSFLIKGDDETEVALFDIENDRFTLYSSQNDGEVLSFDDYYALDFKEYILNTVSRFSAFGIDEVSIWK